MSTSTRKPELRSYQLTINIEPSLFVMVQSVLERENMSASDYGRGLIVQDLIKQGLLNLDDLTRICIMGLLPAVTNGVIQEKLQTRLPIT